MGTLVTAEQFKKAQARAYNRLGIIRVMELRQDARKLFPPVTAQMGETFSATMKDVQQIDSLITFLLDLNGEDGTMGLVKNTGTIPNPEPSGAA